MVSKSFDETAYLKQLNAEMRSVASRVTEQLAPHVEAVREAAREGRTREARDRIDLLILGVGHLTGAVMVSFAMNITGTVPNAVPLLVALTVEQEKAIKKIRDSILDGTFEAKVVVDEGGVPFDFRTMLTGGAA